MRSLGDIVEGLAKHGEIKTSPRQLFTYIPFPEDLRKKFESIAKHVVPEGKVARDLDHCTLLYIPKAEADVAASRIDEILKAMREVCDDTKPIHAKIQGWAYFDGAEEDGVKKTALVALLDAPGLEDLHVELKSTMRRLGFNDAGTHIFTPHVTFAYLELGGRVKDLPLLDGEFDIDKVMFANADKHALPLLGHKSLGQKAAGVVVEADEAGMKALFDRLHRALNGGAPMPEKSAERADRCKVCDKPATVKVLWAEGHGYQPACEAHKEQVAKPFKAKDDFSGFKKIAVEPIGDGIKDGRGYGPYGMGYYHDPVSREALPYGPNGEKLSKEYDYRLDPNGHLGRLREPLKKVASTLVDALRRIRLDQAAKLPPGAMGFLPAEASLARSWEGPLRSSTMTTMPTGRGSMGFMPEALRSTLRHHMQQMETTQPSWFDPTLKQGNVFSLSTSAVRQEPREKDDYKPGGGTADAGGTGGVVDSKVMRGVLSLGKEAAAHVLRRR